ncbi:MAG: M48 family metallopeptidase [Methylocystis sp.]|jgi:predicted Zn-dependent protease
MTEPATDAGEWEAVYFDGRVKRGRLVTLRFGPALEIAESGVFLTAWPYADVRRASAGEGVWILHALGAPELARLEARGPALQAQITARCRLLAGEGARGATSSAIGWSIAGVAAMVGAIWVGIPRAADRIAARVPISMERRLGEAADSQARAAFGTKQCAAPAGAAALAKLSARLRSASDLRLPATIVVLASKTPNAFALPGGKVYLLSGLLAKAENQDEIIGVLAHELGHLQHRDHLCRMIADGGGAYLIGLLFGHVTGGGALIYASKTLLFAAHSRESEAAADAFAAATLAKLGRPAKPMGELLLRITGPEADGATAILHDHPLSQERLDYLAARDKGATGPALLGAEEWAALKTICE